ncbi:MAG: hypothetical protein DYG88_16545 [Chloroflexi bacterium CFX4]|nr:hypothetical protein [Chloroflexi bacterium CFX4]
MDKPKSSLEVVITLALSLPPLEKVRLIEQVVATLEQDLTPQPKPPKRPCYGMWANVNLSAEEIETARQAMERSFPREDV